MMYQYKTFIWKEYKLLIRNKKIIILSMFAIIYAPICNCLATNNLVSLSYGVPLLMIFGTLFPSEITYSIMKSEYESQANEILTISPIKPIIIILSKITIPVFLSIITLVLSNGLNEFLSVYFEKMYHGFITMSFVFMVILISIWSSFLFLYVIQKKDKALYKNVFTGIIMFQFIICTMLFTLYYLNMSHISIVILIFLSYITFRHCLNTFKENSIYINKNESKASNFMRISIIKTLIKDGYCHFWNHKKTIVWLIFSFVLLLCCSINNELIILTKYLYSFLSISLCNNIIYPSTINFYKSSGMLHLKLGKFNYHKFIFTRLSYTFLINLSVSIICILFLKQSIFLFLNINIFSCLSIFLFSSRIRKFAFEKQYNIYLTVLEVLFVVFLITIHYSNLIIYVNVLLYIMTYFSLKYHI